MLSEASPTQKDRCRRTTARPTVDLHVRHCGGPVHTQEAERSCQGQRGAGGGCYLMGRVSAESEEDV